MAKCACGRPDCDVRFLIDKYSHTIQIQDAKGEYRAIYYNAETLTELIAEFQDALADLGKPKCPHCGMTLEDAPAPAGRNDDVTQALLEACEMGDSDGDGPNFLNYIASTLDQETYPLQRNRLRAKANAEEAAIAKARGNG